MGKSLEGLESSFCNFTGSENNSPGVIWGWESGHGDSETEGRLRVVKGTSASDAVGGEVDYQEVGKGRGRPP